MKVKSWWKLVLCVLGCELAGMIGAIFTGPVVGSWYPLLNKPFFNPPSWVFAPVWTLLFFMMGLALYLVILKDPSRKYVKLGKTLFGVQLALNILWSVLFFGFRSPLYALFDIVLLLGFIFLTIVVFYRLEKKAAYLMIPYLLWVAFATILNFSIWILNL